MSQTVEQSRAEVDFDFSRSRRQLLIIQTVRLGFLLVILAITLGFQALQAEFINIDVLIPVYLMMAIAFFLNAIHLFCFEFFLRRWQLMAFLFFFDVVFVSGLIHFTGLTQSVFLFLYLVNIILCGFVFHRRGALVLALITSILFSLVMLTGTEVRGQTLFFAVILNNLAFFAVAALSGILSEQVNFMGSQLIARGRDLRALKNLNELILQNITSGLLTIDREGVVLQCNRAASDLFEVEAKNLLSAQIQIVLPGLFEHIVGLNVGHSEEKSARFDWTFMSPSEGRMTLEMTVSPLREMSEPSANEGGGYVVVVQDLTKVRRLEFAMRQSEKMAAVGGLAAGIAHEIRNPLASISGSIQLLESSFSVRQEEERRLMKIVLKEIDRLNNLISEFLDFVKPHHPVEDPVDCNALIREVMEMVKLNRLLRADVEQVLKLNATQVVAGQKDKLKQALLNIIINAYQALQEATNPRVEVSTEDKGDRVLLKIRDSGSGIDEKNLKKIFEPFHTTKPKGTGLGLAVTHKILENHGVKIFVESTKGVGTEFTLDFPRRASSTSTEAKSHAM